MKDFTKKVKTGNTRVGNDNNKFAFKDGMFGPHEARVSFQRNTATGDAYLELDVYIDNYDRFTVRGLNEIKNLIRKNISEREKSIAGLKQIQKTAEAINAEGEKKWAKAKKEGL